MIVVLFYAILNLIFLLAQLWRFNSKGKLENKLRRWSVAYDTNLTSIIPKNSTEGYIEVLEEGEVFTLNSISKRVRLETKISPITASQTWKLGQKQEKGWRTIQHSQTGLYLTSNYVKPAAFLTVASKGM